MNESGRSVLLRAIEIVLENPANIHEESQSLLAEFCAASGQIFGSSTRSGGGKDHFDVQVYHIGGKARAFFANDWIEVNTEMAYWS